MEAEIHEKEAEMAKLTERWNNEKEKIAAMKGAKARLESARRELELAEVGGCSLCFAQLTTHAFSVSTFSHYLWNVCTDIRCTFSL